MSNMLDTVCGGASTPGGVCVGFYPTLVAYLPFYSPPPGPLAVVVANLNATLALSGAPPPAWLPEPLANGATYLDRVAVGLPASADPAAAPGTVYGGVATFEFTLGVAGGVWVVVTDGNPTDALQAPTHTARPISQ